MVITILLCLLVIEITYRYLYYGKLNLDKIDLSLNKNELTTTQPHEFDQELGYVLKKKFYHSNHPNFGDKIITTYSDGTRSNNSLLKKNFIENDFQQPYFEKEKSILATGDSFTLGNEVGNDETWPAYLEELSSFRVINGGVGGYSFIQTILLTKRLLNENAYKNVILSLIPENLYRSEYSIFQGVPRPYLKKLNANKVEIKYDHILDPRPIIKKNKTKLKIIEILSFSLTLTKLYELIDNDKIINYLGFNSSIDMEGNLSACKLIFELDKILISKKINGYILIQYPDYWILNENILDNNLTNSLTKFKKCIKDTNFILMDSFNHLKETADYSLEDFGGLYINKNRHMSYKGNYYIAEYISENFIN